jgi:phage terminase small subunit
MGTNYVRPRKPVNVPLTPVQIRFIQAFSETFEFNKACKQSQVSPRQAKLYMKEPNVRAALDDLMGVALETSKINASRVAEEYAVMAFSNLLDIIEIGEDGDYIRLKDLDKMPRQFQACIQEVSVTPTKFGNAIKVKLFDKMPALNKLASLTKLDTKVDEKNDANYLDAKAEELMAIAEVIKKKQQGLLNTKAIEAYVEDTGD